MRVSSLRLSLQSSISSSWFSFSLRFQIRSTKRLASMVAATGSSSGESWYRCRQTLWLPSRFSMLSPLGTPSSGLRSSSPIPPSKSSRSACTTTLKLRPALQRMSIRLRTMSWPLRSSPSCRCSSSISCSASRSSLASRDPVLKVNIKIKGLLCKPFLFEHLLNSHILL